jgi:chromosome partitioning protein
MAWNAGTVGQTAGHVVAVCNLKGGTGKSTLSVNIACALATRGVGVALVDNDRQASATLWGSAGKLPITCVSLPLARLEDARPWLEVLLGLRAHYQVVIVDFPAGLPPGLWPTVLMASLILVPTSPNEIEIVATRSMLQRITVLCAARASDPPALLVVPNRIVGAENGPQGYRARLAVLGEELAPPARFRPEHDEAFAERQWIGAARPGSPAHQDVETLAERVRRSLDQARPPSWPPPLVTGSPKADRAPKLLGSPVTVLGRPAAASAPLCLAKPTVAEPKVVFLDERTTAQLRRNGTGSGIRDWATRLVGSLTPRRLQGH